MNRSASEDQLMDMTADEIKKFDYLPIIKKTRTYKKFKADAPYPSLKDFSIPVSWQGSEYYRTELVKFKIRMEQRGIKI